MKLNFCRFIRVTCTFKTIARKLTTKATLMAYIFIMAINDDRVWQLLAQEPLLE